ncbi:unnamed protein product [Hermetia illucens]|uniref:Uncharacterized protein n=1 Tax=Hermetia illucens TaxID=343691 RepID=A0A7R8V3Y0_HERIL|nr:unnamed protein product [Hermetia illucens]
MKAISVENQYEKFSDLEKSEVLKLMEWTNRQKHLPDIEEIEAILFLYSCHNSMELAKQTVDLNFTLRTLCPEFFAKRDTSSSDIQRAMKVW